VRPLPHAALATMALGLTACVSAAPLELADDHPANPAAASGLIATPSAIEGYKSPNDFIARATADANAPPSSHAGHGGHAGMQRGSMQMGGGMAGMDHSAMDHSRMQGGAAQSGAATR
jgi:hypothetical protein